MNKITYLILLAFIAISCEKNETQSPNLYPIEVNHLWGYIDIEGNIAIEPQYDDAWPFYYDRASVLINEKWGCIDSKGKLVINGISEVAINFYDGKFAPVRINNKYGYINKKGDFIIHPEFDFAYGFQNGYAVVYIGSDYGIINIEGEKVIPIEYKGATVFNEGFAFIAKNINGDKLWAIIDENGDLKTDFLFKEVVYQLDESSFFVNQPNFRDGVASVEYNNKLCFIDYNGDVLLETDFQFLGSVNEGMISIIQDDLFGFIDKTGEIVIDPTYEFLLGSQFSDGIAPVKNQESKCGFIDKNNNTVIPFDYLYCTGFYHELLYVVFDDNTDGYIDRNNNVIWRNTEVPNEIMYSKIKEKEFDLENFTNIR